VNGRRGGADDEGEDGEELHGGGARTGR
jgi:hypothetical protein